MEVEWNEACSIPTQKKRHTKTKVSKHSSKTENTEVQQRRMVVVVIVMEEQYSVEREREKKRCVACSST